MLNSKTVSRETYNRNIKSGKWIELRTPTEIRGYIQTTTTTRGVYNQAGRCFLIWFSEPKTNTHAAETAARRMLIVCPNCQQAPCRGLMQCPVELSQWQS